MNISGTISHCPPQICGIFSSGCKLSKLNVYFPSLSLLLSSNHQKVTICLTKVSSIPCPIFSITMVLLMLKNSFTNLASSQFFFCHNKRQSSIAVKYTGSELRPCEVQIHIDWLGSLCQVT